MFDLGDVVPLRFNIAVNGTATNATSHLLTITQPDGVAVTSSSLTNTVVGQYDYDFQTAQAGRHLVRFVTTGTGQAAYTDVFDVRSATPTSIVSLADVRAELNNSSTASDDEIRAYVDRATALLESKTGRVFAQRTVTDAFDVYATDAVILLKPPTVSITEVTLNGSTLAADSYRFNARSGILELDGWRFGSSGVGLVEVTYVAGYSVPPDDLKHAVLRQVAHMWENQRTTPGSRRNPDEYTPGYLIPNAVLEAINGYMVLGPGA